VIGIEVSRLQRRRRQVLLQELDPLPSSGLDPLAAPENSGYGDAEAAREE
jgi:hypothetical protein